MCFFFSYCCCRRRSSPPMQSQVNQIWENGERLKYRNMCRQNRNQHFLTPRRMNVLEAWYVFLSSSSFSFLSSSAVTVHQQFKSCMCKTSQSDNIFDSCTQSLCPFKINICNAYVTQHGGSSMRTICLTMDATSSNTRLEVVVLKNENTEPRRSIQKMLYCVALRFCTTIQISVCVCVCVWHLELHFLVSTIT